MIYTWNEKMTIEEIFCELCSKYGDDFNWHMIPYTSHTFVEELKRELAPDDAFLEDQIFSVLKSDSNDDVLYLGSYNGKESWRIYHLTYCNYKASETLKFVEFSNRIEAMNYIERQFVSEYL